MKIDSEEKAIFSIIHVLTHPALLDSQCIINTLKSFRALYSLKSLIL